MKTMILQTLSLVNKGLTSAVRRNPSVARRGSLLIPVSLVCFALCQQVQSATDAPGTPRQMQSATDGPEQVQNVPDTPDPGPLPISNTADGQLALASVAGGTYNSAFGFYSLLSLADGSFNTGLGAGTLMVSTASNNTAVGAGALFSNT